ncbi:BA75_03145T0 [Komagataella pastoris]|uniref:BA75_03145T0 n=1 Tax=Komagataella pastoris TaxID=4922 RepID=A0A1B2JAX6_PICPA|nr:BA75_03145T0 [Komagataella pastoris]
MDEAELNAIRAARMAELRQNQGSGAAQGSSTADSPGAGSNDQHENLLANALTIEAKERLSRVRMVKPHRAQAVEQYVIRLATSGQLRRRLGEEEIVEILDGLARDEQKQSGKIVFSRQQKYGDDDDDGFFD